MSLSMMFVPLTAWVMMKVRPPRARVGSACRSRWLARAAQSAYADSLPPKSGLVLLTALVQSIWFCYTSRCAREVPLIP